MNTKASFYAGWGLFTLGTLGGAAIGMYNFQLQHKQRIMVPSQRRAVRGRAVDNDFSQEAPLKRQRIEEELKQTAEREEAESKAAIARIKAQWQENPR
jgi:hypothetical protein